MTAKHIDLSIDSVREAPLYHDLQDKTGFRSRTERVRGLARIGLRVEEGMGEMAAGWMPTWDALGFSQGALEGQEGVRRASPVSIRLKVKIEALDALYEALEAIQGMGQNWRLLGLVRLGMWQERRWLQDGCLEQAMQARAPSGAPKGMGQGILTRPEKDGDNIKPTASQEDKAMLAMMGMTNE